MVLDDKTSQGRIGSAPAAFSGAKRLAHPPKAALAYFSPDHIRLLNSSKLAPLTESHEHKNKSAEK
jgi:hypothetical protein